MLLPHEVMKFKHSVRTSVKDKRLSYTDAIVLAFASLGNPDKGCAPVEVMKLVDTWKVVPHPTFVQYITSTYCGENAKSTTTLKVKKDPDSPKVATLWYKVREGRYALTDLGKSRVGSLMDAFRASPVESKKKLSGSTKKVAAKAREPKPRASAPMDVAKKEIALAPVHQPVIPLPPTPVRSAEVISALLTLRPLPPNITAHQLIDVLGEFAGLKRKYNLDKNAAQRIIELIF